MSDDKHEVEAIVAHRIFRGKDQYRVKRHGSNETKWEHVDNLFDAMELVSEFMTKKQQQSKVLDQIIGCGQRRGQKYFLVRFRGHDKTEIIDWEAAKQYSIDVMEFFGSRTVWTDLRNIVNPDVCDDSEEDDDDGDDDDAAKETAALKNLNKPSTSQIDQLNAYPNEIEFEK